MSAISGRAAGWLPWAVYPAVMVLCLALHVAMTQSGYDSTFATVFPVVLGAGTITLLERILPHDRDWSGRWSDVRQDILFMLLIQGVLPRVLVILVVLSVAGSVSATITPSSAWPHHWPVAIQAALMLVSADFLRYWLHRLAHQNKFLWRFHAVHHSPHKLYWLNVGRFHPLDKFLQFLLDALPFVLLGVGEAVLSLYFVFYAVNGFFQHSNVEMRFGFLNYVISSAELHRWHHSRVPSESNTNYGNNLIIWDLIFGTRFLPSDREIHDLGLKNTRYPMAFSRQMIAPFTPLLTDRDVSLSGLENSVLNLLIRMRISFIERRYLRPLLQATRQPRQTQMRVLRDILKHNESTQYGREHHFSEVNDYASFCRQVPVNGYEDLRSYIEAQEATGLASLVNDPVVMFATTSGTTALPKWLPVTERMLRDFRRSQAIFSCLQQRHRPLAFNGRYLGIVGSAVEGHTERGTPFGSVSGVLYRTMPLPARRKYILPRSVFEIDDYSLKYYLILRLALMHQDLSYIACANPSTLLKLESLINEELVRYTDEIRSGQLRPVAELGDLPPKLRRKLIRRTKPAPQRAERLAALHSAIPNVRLTDVWPELAMITTWKSGSCGIAFKALEPGLDSSTAVVELGYLSSEFRGTFTWDHETGAGIPTIQDNFYEFVAVSDREADEDNFVTLDQIERGVDYYVFVTTRGGLYRYDMNDIVRVEGFLNETPLLRFVQKGRGVTSITGEKLYESQVIESVDTALHRLGASSPFYLMVADPAGAVYRLFIELGDPVSVDGGLLSDSIDDLLGRSNLEYKAKRDSGRLAPVEVRILAPGTGERYKAFCVQRGQKEGQFKVVALQHSDQVGFDLSRHIV